MVKDHCQIYRLKIPNYKYQISNKFQNTIFNDQNNYPALHAVQTLIAINHPIYTFSYIRKHEFKFIPEINDSHSRHVWNIDPPKAGWILFGRAASSVELI